MHQKTTSEIYSTPVYSFAQPTSSRGRRDTPQTVVEQSWPPHVQGATLLRPSVGQAVGALSMFEQPTLANTQVRRGLHIACRQERLLRKKRSVLLVPLRATAYVSAGRAWKHGIYPIFANAQKLVVFGAKRQRESQDGLRHQTEG